MRKFNFLIFALLITWSAQAQFINNGATVIIQSGATLKVETNFVNNSGTVTNNGTLEVTGHFENNATFTSGSASLVKFSGNAASNAKSNLAVLNDVEMAKASANVTLTDAMSINGDLSFTGTASKIVLDGNNLTLAAASDVNTPGANGYVVTNSTGALVKGIAANGPKNMEVGDMSNYSPVSNVVSGSGYTSATISARAYITGLQPKYAETTDYINREWNVIATGITGYANTMTGTYNPALAPTGDRDGNLMFIKGATYHSNPTPDWRFDGSAGNGSNTVTASTTTSDVRFSGKNFFGKANLKAFLGGAYSAGSMTTTLNSLGLLPTTSPYVDAPASVGAGFFAANPTIVDWVRIELRDPSAPSTPTTFKASAFIKSDGSIVGLDGTTFPIIKNGFSTSVVVLSHRNHLPIRTPNIGIDVVNPPVMPHDFSAGLTFGTNAQRVISGTSVMWPGNALVDGFVRFSGSDNDADVIKNNILSQPGNPFGSLTFSYSAYNVFDLNLDGTIRFSGTNNDKDEIKNNILAHPANPFGSLTYTINQQLYY
jgi:hypothetical protein